MRFAWLFVLATMSVMVACVDDDSSDKDRNHLTEAADSLDTASDFHITDTGVVDLGLSVRWAACNLGAQNAWDYGDYYAWGETEPKSVFSWNTYQHHKDSVLVDIGLDIAGTRYDAARAKLGDDWRMPTLSDVRELLDKCTWRWMEYHDTAGYAVTGPNGGTIFLPAAGCRWGSVSYGAGVYGFYWSSALYDEEPNNAYTLYFYAKTMYWTYFDRADGRTIRPVRQN